ncbi:hypothetical protein DHEL01_v207560 [Diaporthe helianthi]|uniref:Rhodopsin domain-containing protein n=1 Tax=Diaporthe helianthi TaxID=158607 RepID=A0A2P5HUW9_DIAHE|nr:hypothetical protein DHEL01_v207560 [Diaporthe helianthi]
MWLAMEPSPSAIGLSAMRLSAQVVEMPYAPTQVRLGSSSISSSSTGFNGDLSHDAARHDPGGESRTPGQGGFLSMATAATIFVAARAYGCSRIMRRRLYAEEWLSVLSLAMVWLNVSFMTVGFFSGLSRHNAVLSHEQQVTAKFWYNMGTPPSVINLAVSKMSVVCLLCRVFKPGELHRAAMWSLVILCLLGFLTVSFLAFFGCKPVQASWDPTVQGAKCLQSTRFVQYCYFAADDATHLIIWTTAEGCLMLISACVPTLHPVYDRIQYFLRRLFGMTVTSHYDTANWEHDDDHQPARQVGGFWTEKLGSILKSITSSSVTTATTATTPTIQTRTLEDAATVTRPPAVIWHTSIVKSTRGLRSTCRELRAYRSKP